MLKSPKDCCLLLFLPGLPSSPFHPLGLFPTSGRDGPATYHYGAQNSFRDASAFGLLGLLLLVCFVLIGEDFEVLSSHVHLSRRPCRGGATLPRST